MNTAFKQINRIDLEHNVWLEADAFNGVVLIFRTETTKKNKNTGEVEPFNADDKYYFPRITQALSKYSEVALNSSATINELLAKSIEIFDLIKKMQLELKN